MMRRVGVEGRGQVLHRVCPVHSDAAMMHDSRPDPMARDSRPDPMAREIIIKNLENGLRTNQGGSIFIEQLKEVVRRQNTEIDELKKSNALGIPVGIAGVLLTLLFGIVSLLYPLLSKKRDNKWVKLNGTTLQYA